MKNQEELIQNKIYNYGNYLLNLNLISEDQTNSGLAVSNLNSNRKIIDGNLGQFQLVRGQLSTGSFKILSSGNFTITSKSIEFTELNIKSATTSKLKILNKVSRIELSISETNVKTFQQIIVTIKLFGDDDNPYLLSANASIYDLNENIYGNFANSAGNCMGSIQILKDGNFSFYAKSGNKSSNKITLISTKWNLSPLSLIFVIII